MSENKKYKIVIEEDENENNFYKQIYTELKKDGTYHRHYGYELLLYNKNGFKTYFDMIFITINASNPHIEYIMRISMNGLHIDQRIYKSLQEYKDIKLSDIKKHVLKIKNFKFCDKCAFAIDDNTKCQCIRNEEKYKETLVLKKILNISIEEETCPICLEKLESTYDAIYFVKCEKPHYFHIQCLSKINDATCPICKTHCHHLKYRNNYYNFNCNNHHEDDDYFSDEDEYN